MPETKSRQFFAHPKETYIAILAAGAIAVHLVLRYATGSSPLVAFSPLYLALVTTHPRCWRRPWAWPSGRTATSPPRPRARSSWRCRWTRWTNSSTSGGGFLPPIGGANTQEIIDVVAVLNAVRVALPAGELRDF